MVTERRGNMTQDQNDMVMTLWLKRFSAKEIAAHFDVTPQAIHTKIRIFQAMGLKQEPKRSIADVLAEEKANPSTPMHDMLEETKYDTLLQPLNDKPQVVDQDEDLTDQMATQRKDHEAWEAQTLEQQETEDRGETDADREFDKEFAKREAELNGEG